MKLRFSTAVYNRLRKRVEKATGKKLPALKRPAQKKNQALGPNLTELSFNRTILAGQGSFIGQDRRACSFTLTSLGSRYTPDFTYAGPKLDTQKVPRFVIIEVKGKYRSKKDAELIERRSRLAWEVASDQHPEYDWVWAKLKRRGEWECTLRDGRDAPGETFKKLCRSNADFEKLLKGKV